MGPYLPPIERPKGLFMKLMFAITRRVLGKVPTPLATASARMPGAFLRFGFKISLLDRKLTLPRPIAELIRERVATLNSCEFCMDTKRWFAMRTSPEELPRFDALSEYRSSPLFSERERVALDYATELTENKKVSPETFAQLARFYDEREICEIVWLVASEHFYNLSNHGLNIGSDELCKLRPASKRAKASTSTPT
jgi:alkylhydroperoxidase family enzyme